MVNDALAATYTTWAYTQIPWGVLFVAAVATIVAAIALAKQNGWGFIDALPVLAGGLLAIGLIGTVFDAIAGDDAPRSNTDAIVAELSDKYGATVNNEDALYAQVRAYRYDKLAPATIDDVALETPEGPVVVQLVFPDNSPGNVVALRTTPPGAELPLVSGES